MTWISLLILVGAYGIGTISTGYLLVHWRTGQDIRQVGSGATGARNAGRLLGRWGMAAVIFGDLLKGALPVAGARWLGLPDLVVTLTLLAVVAGHIWPPQLGFRGGKGLSTGLGGLIAISPSLALGVLAVSGLLALLLRNDTLGVLGVILFLPAAVALLGYPSALWTGLIPVSLLIINAHRENLRTIWVDGRRAE